MARETRAERKHRVAVEELLRTARAWARDRRAASMWSLTTSERFLLDAVDRLARRAKDLGQERARETRDRKYLVTNSASEPK